MKSLSSILFPHALALIEYFRILLTLIFTCGDFGWQIGIASARTRSKQVVLYHCQDHRVMPVGQLHCWNSHCHSMTPRKLLHEVAIHLMLSSMATQLRSWCVTGCWTSGKFERERTLDSGPGLRRGDA